MSRKQQKNKNKDKMVLLVNEITDKVWEQLNDENREKLKKTSSSPLHFTFGIQIRNKYIHNDKRCKDIDADNLSAAIIGKLIRRAKEIDENVSIIELIMFT